MPRSRRDRAKNGSKGNDSAIHVERAHDIAERDDFHDLLAVLEHKQGASRPPQVVESTAESTAIRTIFMEETHRTIPERETRRAGSTGSSIF